MEGDSQLKQIQQLLLRWRKLVFVAGTFLVVNSAQAQTAVTSITYGSLVDNADQTTGGITYLNRDRTVTSVNTSSLGNYQFTGPLATNVYFRRNTDSNGNGTSNQAADNPNNTTIIYQVNGSSQDYGNRQTTAEGVFLDGNLYSGIRNPFANGAGLTVAFFGWRRVRPVKVAA